jgi:serine/threonine-protein kinase
MGQVYRATHRMLARPAAIKLIRPEVLALGGADAARVATARFHREAQAAAQLRSPHTVELYDFGVADDGTLYTVMELLEGLSLQELVERHGPMPASRVVHVLRQVCDSLAEAHASGLVHRDIKPGNIHLGRLGLRWDVAKVLDFGLVKAVPGADLEHSLATIAGYAPGTPAYMAPETVSDDGVDGRTDLYALGCVAYFLLTGRLVFDADTPLQMLARHLQDVPLAPSRWTDEPLPPALDDLVLACLAKSPADRPGGALTLSRALAALPIEPWSEEEAATWWSLEARRALTESRAERILTFTETAS